jgi:tetratricopeptide (TPR) repeat protein
MMRPKVWRSGQLALALVVLTLGSVSMAGADYKDSYKNGIQAYESASWAAAERYFLEAIAENPESKGGTLVRQYTPYYYLGLARTELGRCREAIQSLDEAERQDKIKSKELEILRNRRQGCIDLVTRVDEERKVAQSLVDEASEAAFSVARVQASPVLSAEWNQGSNSFSDRQNRWKAQIDTARQLLREGDEGLDARRLQEAQRLAAEAQDQLEALETDAINRRRDLQPVVDSRLRGIQESIAATQRDIDFVRNNLSPLPPALETTLRDAAAAVTAASAADASTSIPVLDTLLGDLKRQLQSLRSAVRAPPTDLMDAAAAYFRGDYPRSLELLDKVTDEEPRVAAQVCLFKAASLFSQARIEPSADPNAAAAQLQACRQLSLVIPPPADRFAPDFVAEWVKIMDSAEATDTDN